jgi:LEA14-like dessication related protein
MKYFFKILLGIGGALVLLLLLCFIAWKIFPDKISSYFIPDIHDIKVTTTSLKSGKLRMTAESSVSRAIIPFFLDSMTYKATLYGDTVASGKKDFHAPDTSGGRLSIPVIVDINSIMAKNDVHQGDSTYLGVLANIFFKIPLLEEKKIRIYKNVKFKMLVYPKITVDKIDIEHFGFNDMRLKMKLKIVNPNDLSFRINSLKYTMQVEDHLLTTGKTNGHYFLKANGTSFATLEMKADVDKPVKAVLEAVKGKKEWPYIMHMHVSIKPSLKNIEDIEMPVLLKGNLDKKGVKAMAARSK